MNFKIIPETKNIYKKKNSKRTKHQKYQKKVTNSQNFRKIQKKCFEEENNVKKYLLY